MGLFKAGAVSTGSRGLNFRYILLAEALTAASMSWFLRCSTLFLCDYWVMLLFFLCCSRDLILIEFYFAPMSIFSWLWDPSLNSCWNSMAAFL